MHATSAALRGQPLERAQLVESFMVVLIVGEVGVWRCFCDGVGASIRFLEASRHGIFCLSAGRCTAPLIEAKGAVQRQKCRSKAKRHSKNSG
jgi:hypothetical protein